MDLFSPYPRLDLRNRSVMAPLTRFNSELNGCPSPDLASYYVRRAQHDTGLIIVESCAINSKAAMGYINGLQFFSEVHAEKWAPIVKKVHDSGAKIWIQLFHAGRLTVPEICHGNPMSPSAIKPSDHLSYWRPKMGDETVNFQTQTPYVLPSEMSVSEIQHVILDFQKAALLAENAGFDGIEIHGAHGYLVHTFMTTLTNSRTDNYGLMHGHKFIESLVRACREVLLRSTILSFRCSVHMVDNPLIRFNGINFNLVDIIKTLDLNGVDVFHSSQIDSKNPIFGAKETLYQLIRANTQKPIIVCGGIQTLKDANNILNNDNDTLIAFGRNFISNPNLISILKSGKESEIVKFEYSKHIDKVF